MTEPRIQPGRVTALLRDMVDIYSPSGKEHEITAFLAETLQGTGLDVVSTEVGDGRCNLLVSSGKSAPELLFLGHVDTVPAFDIEHYDFSERDGTGYGLGTADMKGGCAAMLEAFMAAAEAGCLPDHVLLALVVGEEETGDGTQALLEQFRFGRALVGEPTGLKPCLDHFGYVEMNVRAFGSRRHAAVAGRDTNAIRALLRVLLRLEEYVDAGDPDVVLNIRDLHSSESGAVALGKIVMFNIKGRHGIDMPQEEQFRGSPATGDQQVAAAVADLGEDDIQPGSPQGIG